MANPNRLRENIESLGQDDILNLTQLVQHPGWPVFNRLLLMQIELETEDFVSRDLVDDKEIVNRYKDLRGVHKAVGGTLNVVKMALGQVLPTQNEEQETPNYFPEQK